jgi:ribosomal-protein-alanine N-acetyltransferase
MTRADLPAAGLMERDLFGDEAWTEGMLASELAGTAGGRFYLVADASDGEIVGYAGLLAPGGGQADVLTMAVAQDRWGMGIGTRLLEALIDEARRRCCTEMFLEVRADNTRAQRLYRGHGFEKIGIRRAYYQPSGTDAIVMRRSLPPLAADPPRPASRMAGGPAGGTG